MSTSSRPTNLLDPGFCLTLRPMSYPKFFDMYKDAIKNTWTVDEVDFSRDVGHLRDRMMPSERHMIHRLVAFFATGDSIVANNLVLNLYKHINAPEARMYLGRQLYEECLHVQFYLTLLDTYVPDEKERAAAFNAIENIPSIRKKAEFCEKWIDSVYHLDTIQTVEQRRQFLLNLIAFASCVEGLFFFGAFAYVYFMRSKGLLNGLADGTAWVFRDETCLHPDTEVLTPRGWIRFPELKDSDEVAQYCMTTGDTSFTRPQRIVRKQYSGKMHRFFHEKGGIDQLVTADHDVVQKWDYQASYSKQKAEDFVLNGKKMIPVSGRWIKRGVGLSPQERFLIALQADGTLPNEVRNGKFCGTRPVSFTLKKERKITRLNAILSELGWKYTTSFKKERGVTCYRIDIPADFEISKTFSDWVDLGSRSLEWCQEFLEEITHWDGHFPKSGKYRQYITTMEENSDTVQAVAALCGHHAFKSPRQDNRKESYKDVFNVYTSKKEHVRCKTMQREVSDYDGMVYCVSVPQGAIIIRYNNKVSVTGNCHMNFAFSVVDTVREEQPELFDEKLHQDVLQMLEDAIDCEVQFAEDLLGGSIVGLSVSDMRTYLQFCADQRLARLGYPRRYNVKNPLEFMELQDVQEVTNFFERRVSAYQVGISGEVDFDQDF